MLRSARFSIDNRPQCTSSNWSRPAQRLRVSTQNRRGWNICRSTPNGTVMTLVAPTRSNSSRAKVVVHSTVS